MIRRLGSVRTYYDMPDAETQAILAARGDTIQIVLRPEDAPPPPPQPSLDEYRAAAGVQTENCALTDSACVQRNVDRMMAANIQYTVKRDAWLRQYANDPRAWDSPAISPAISPPAAPPTATAVAFRSGTLQFVNLTTGDAALLHVGDRWRVTITGASPNVQVSVRGGKDGANIAAAMGATDSAGNFSLSGQITADQVGAWSEEWFVSSAKSGAFSFRVIGADAPVTPPGQPPDDDTNQAPGWNININALPWWAWAAAAGAVLLIVRSGK